MRIPQIIDWTYSLLILNVWLCSKYLEAFKLACPNNQIFLLVIFILLQEHISMNNHGPWTDSWKAFPKFYLTRWAAIHSFLHPASKGLFSSVRTHCNAVDKPMQQNKFFCTTSRNPYSKTDCNHWSIHSEQRTRSCSQKYDYSLEIILFAQQ